MLTLFLLNLILNVASAEAPNAPRDMNYRLGVDMSYFTTSTNYLAGGFTTEGLRNDGHFTDLRTRVIYEQDLDSTKRLYGGFIYSATESSDGLITRNNSGFNELLAGGQYWVKFLSFKAAPSVDLVYPLARVDRGRDDVLLGEGAIKLKLGSWLLWPRGRLIPFGYLGYEYRDEGRSHALPYSIGLKWKTSEFWAQFDYSGYERLLANADTENRNARDIFLRRVDGGSYRYYAINSSLSEASVSAGYRLSSVTIMGGAAITVNGSTEAQGVTFFGGLRFSPLLEKAEPDPFSGFHESEPLPEDNFDDLDPTRAPPEEVLAPPPPAPMPRVPKKVSPRAQPDQAQPTIQLRAKPKPKPKKIKKPKKNNVDKLLDETEKGLKNL